MGRRRRPNTIRGTTLLPLALLVLAACAPRIDHGGVEPVDGEPAEARERHDATTTEPAPSTVAPTTAPPTTSERAPTTATEELRAQVDVVLERYAEALTTIAADPERRARPGTSERAAWDRTVLAGSMLSEDLLGALVRRHREDRMVVRPGSGGLSYRHRPLVVEPPRGGTISFTWCGWSPGIGIDADDGGVLDDGVAHSHGTGQLRLVEGHWMLELLDELDLSVLAPGSPDPCPAEVEALVRSDREDGAR